MTSLICLILLLIGSPLAMADADLPGPSPQMYIYGNHVYDDETILKIAGIDYHLSTKEMESKLETTGFFSRVQVVRKNGEIIIYVREKTPWFALPYFSSDSHAQIYGIAGGWMGLGGGHSMLLGRVQSGSSSKAASLLFRDEFVHDSLWIVGGAFDYEDAEHDIFEGRETKQHIPNKAVSFSLQSGYHLRPNLVVRLDHHLEQHRTEEIPGHAVSGTQWSHRFLAEYGNFYLDEGLARGYLIHPYIEFTNPWSDFKFFQYGISAERGMYLKGNFNWIARGRFEHGTNLPFHQRFEIGGAKLRGFPSQSFRVSSYSAIQNDFLLTSWDLWKLRIRPILFADFAYLEKSVRPGVGTGVQVYFRSVAVPAIQIYGGYGFNPNGMAIIATIGPQI